MEKIALEIYLLFRKAAGSFSSVSGFLGRNDSSKISRQINPSDDRRDNPYTELLEIQQALMSFSPDLEESVWQILERERAKFRAQNPTRRTQIAELLQKTHSELGDVIFANNTGASKETLQKEAFELLEAAKNLHEQTSCGFNPQTTGGGKMIG